MHPLAPQERHLLWIAAGFLLSAAVLLFLAFSIPSFAPNEDIEEQPYDETPLEESEFPPLFITSMTHMEGKYKYDVDEDLFNRHIDQLTWAMDLFDEYDAKMTVETEASFARANTVWDRNFLQEVIERGHGVGTHADFGAEISPKDLPFYIRAFKTNKQLVDDLVGAEHNKGISGGIGAYDWVTAMSRAGFSYVDGVVGFAYLSMDLDKRPEGWTDAVIRNSAYHDPAPVDFAERVTMYDLANANDFIPDENGILTISGGEIGELASLAEGRQGCNPNCVLTTDDIDVYLQAIADADEVRRETGMPAKVNVHIPIQLFSEENEDVFRYLLAESQEYATTHEQVQWSTQLAAFEGYREWLNR